MLPVDSGGFGFSEFFTNTGTGVFTQNRNVPLGTSLDAAGGLASDFNRDGLVDIIISGPGGGGGDTRRMFMSRTCLDGYASKPAAWQTRAQAACTRASGSYANRADAEAACQRGGCFGIYDQGCDGSGTWQVCQASSQTWTAAASDCVFEAMRDTICYACPGYGLSRLTSPVTSCEFCPAGRVGPQGIAAITGSQEYLCLACEPGVVGLSYSAVS